MRYQQTEISVEAVVVVNRHRTDLGDLGDLVESIGRIGLMHPILVTPGLELIAGQRRLEAVRKMGDTTIKAFIITELDDAVTRLEIERDENTARKPMTAGELVSLMKALDALERPKAMARRAEAGRSATARRGSINGGGQEATWLTGDKGKRRDVVANALGVSSTHLRRAKAVVEAAEDPNATREARERAERALAEMNATGNVSSAYNKVYTPRRAPTIDKAAEQRRILDRADVTLFGIVHALKLIETLHPDITCEEAAHWVDGLSKSRQIITALINDLRKRTNASA